MGRKKILARNLFNVLGSLEKIVGSESNSVAQDVCLKSIGTLEKVFGQKKNLGHKQYLFKPDKNF